MGLITSSGELIAEFGNQQQTKALKQNTMSLSYNDATIESNSIPNKKRIYHPQNAFKDYMGYVEPDYLRVAGLYASVETSPKSKMYGNFLVKKADYAAEALGWYTEDGKLDIKRAENAIRTACRTKAPNGLYYMYSVSNKDRYLSDKGGSRLYMSGRRYQELVDETTYLENKYSKMDTQIKVSELVPPQITQDHQRIQYMLREVAERHELVIFEERQIRWMADQFVQELNMRSFERYCDLVTSDWYCKQAACDRFCPKLLKILDIYYKHKKVVDYYEQHRK